MAIIPQLDRLQAQLLNSGLSQKNSSLYQVIDQLIKALRQGIDEVEAQVIAITPSSSSPSGGGTIITSATPLGDIGDDNEQDWNWGPPGPKGETGSIGPSGMPGIDGEDGQDGMDGPQGPQGIQGLIGPMGPAGLDGEDCECESMPFVGNSILSTTGNFTQLIP